MKTQPWSEQEAKYRLSRRLRGAREYRNRFEPVWSTSEQTVFAALGNTRSLTSSVLGNLSSVYGSGQEEINSSDVESNVSYAFKNLRFIHAQLSANPPSVVIRPTSSDPEDRLKADAADRLVRHAIRAYSMQEKQDLCSLNTLTYGSGYIKLYYNGDAGEILGVDDEGNLEMEGEIKVEVPSTWDIFIDPDASVWDEVRYVFHRVYMDYDEAVAKWPQHKDLFDKARRYRDTAMGGQGYKESTTLTDQVELYDYWEKGLNINGYLG